MPTLTAPPQAADVVYIADDDPNPYVVSGPDNLGSRVLASFGIPHPLWCTELTCGFVLSADRRTGRVWHFYAVLPDNGQVGVELEQADLVTVDGEHLARQEPEVRVLLPDGVTDPDGAVNPDNGVLSIRAAYRLAVDISWGCGLATVLPPAQAARLAAGIRMARHLAKCEQWAGERVLDNDHQKESTTHA